MLRAFTTLAFSPSVRATQARYGSRERMEQVAAPRTGPHPPVRGSFHLPAAPRQQRASGHG